MLIGKFDIQCHCLPDIVHKQRVYTLAYHRPSPNDEQLEI